MRAARQWLTAEGHREEVLRLCVALAAFWNVRGHWVEGQRLLAATLQQASDAPALLRARALHGRGVLEYLLGAMGESRRAHEHAIELCRSTGEERLLGECLYRAGQAARFQADLPALQRFTDMLAELAERGAGARGRADHHS